MSIADIFRTDIAESPKVKRGSRMALIAVKQLLASWLARYVYSALAIVIALVTNQMEAALTILVLAVISNLLHSVLATHTRRIIDPLFPKSSKPHSRKLANTPSASPEIASWFADFLACALLGVALVSLLLHRSWEAVIPVFLIGGALKVRMVSQLPIINAVAALKRSGVVLTSASQIEQLANVNTFVLDETELIRSDTGEVVSFRPVSGTRFDAVLAAAVSSMKHSWSAGIARAITKVAKQRRVAAVDARVELCSIEKFAGAATYHLLAPNGTLLGKARVSDSPEMDKESVQLLRRMKLDTFLLTSEEQAPARQRAAVLGMNKYEPELFPDDAQHKIATMLCEGKRIAVIKTIPGASSPSISRAWMPTQAGAPWREFLVVDSSFGNAVMALRVSQTTSKLVELILVIYLLLASVLLGMAMATVLASTVAAFIAYGTDLTLLLCFGWFTSTPWWARELGSVMHVHRS